MSKKKLFFAITIILATLFILCSCSQGSIEPEVLLPNNEETKPTHQEQEEDNSQLTEEKVATGRFYIDKTTGFGISMDIPEQYIDKIDISVSVDQTELYICHKETNWKIATIKLLPNSQQNPNDPLDDFIFIWTLNEMANNNNEIGVEINTIRKFAQQMAESIKFIELEPNLDSGKEENTNSEKIPDDEQIDETTPDDTNSENSTPNI